MKKLLITLATISFLLILACKRERNQTMTVICDCTGVYLRMDGKDYHVCNESMLFPFADNSEVVASFKKIKECNSLSSRNAVCTQYHKNEGRIRVSFVRAD